MSTIEGLQTEPRTLPYRTAGSEASEENAQLIHRLPNPMSSQLSSHSPSWYIPSETDSSLATSTAGPNLGHQAFESAVYDYAGHGHAYLNHGWTLPGYPCRYDPHARRDPINYPSPPIQLVKALDSTFYDPYPRFVGYGEIYTDDARMKPGDGIRRQCFNCKATETTTWRRSMLIFGKLLCNKCGLFERTHGVPRPKAFPRRRRHRSRTSSTDQSVTRARSNSDEHCTTSSPYTSYTSSPETLYTSRPYTSNTSQFPDVFNAVDGATTSQDTPWMTRDIRRLSPTPSHLSSSHSATAEQPVDYHTDFQFLSYTVPS